MDQNSTTGTSAPVAPKAKDLKKKYGTRKSPLVVSSAATAYKKDMPFDEQFKDTITTNSWIVIDPALVHPELPETAGGTLVRANTYNSNLGERVDVLNKSNCRDIPSEKDQKKVLRGYTKCELSEVPFITVAE